MYFLLRDEIDSYIGSLPPRRLSVASPGRCASRL
jgi:hypothetical protein